MRLWMPRPRVDKVRAADRLPQRRLIQRLGVDEAREVAGAWHHLNRRLRHMGGEARACAADGLCFCSGGPLPLQRGPSASLTFDQSRADRTHHAGKVRYSRGRMVRLGGAKSHRRDGLAGIAPGEMVSGPESHICAMLLNGEHKTAQVERMPTQIPSPAGDTSLASAVTSVAWLRLPCHSPAEVRLRPRRSLRASNRGQ